MAFDCIWSSRCKRNFRICRECDLECRRIRFQIECSTLEWAACQITTIQWTTTRTNACQWPVNRWCRITCPVKWWEISTEWLVFVLTLLMAQWVGMEASASTHWTHVSAWPPYLRLIWDSIFTHWAIRRFIFSRFFSNREHNYFRVRGIWWPRAIPKAQWETINTWATWVAKCHVSLYMIFSPFSAWVRLQKMPLDLDLTFFV